MFPKQKNKTNSALDLEQTHLEPHRLQNHPPKSPSPNLLPKNTTHWRPQPHPQLKFIQAQITLVRVHDPIIVHHSNHQPTRESVPIEKSHGGHRERQQTVPQAVESLCEEARGGSRVVEVQAV